LSLGQGAASGWHYDAGGPSSANLSGGLALLRDTSGNDSYSGAVFVQGIGYWFGIGVLADAGGNDRYDGLYCAQAAATHFALAALLEGGGDDTYQALHDRAIGWATDYNWAAATLNRTNTNVYNATISDHLILYTGNTDRRPRRSLMILRVCCATHSGFQLSRE